MIRAQPSDFVDGWHYASWLAILDAEELIRDAVESHHGDDQRYVLKFARSALSRSIEYLEMSNLERSPLHESRGYPRLALMERQARLRAALAFVRLQPSRRTRWGVVEV